MLSGRYWKSIHWLSDENMPESKNSQTRSEKLELVPKKVREFTDDDRRYATLSSDIELADDEMARKMLNEITIELPNTIMETNLLDFNQSLTTPLKLDFKPKANLNYYLIGVPINIMLPDHTEMMRFVLKLDMKSAGKGEDAPRAWDLCPRDQANTKEILSGSASIDVGKALKFIPVVGTPLTDVLTLKLDVPFSWKTTTVMVQCSNVMSNPVKWYVKDQSIQRGFIGYVIIEAPKQTHIDIDANLAVEIKKTDLISRLTFRASGASMTTKAYHIEGKKAG